MEKDCCGHKKFFFLILVQSYDIYNIDSFVSFLSSLSFLGQRVKKTEPKENGSTSTSMDMIIRSLIDQNGSYVHWNDLREIKILKLYLQKDCCGHRKDFFNLDVSAQDPIL